jgi:uncharacterized membrane protein
MTRDPLYILGVLSLLIVVSEWLVRRTALRHAGTALLVILVTAVFANVGLLPAGSSAENPVPVYDAIFAYVAPLAIFWLLLRVNLRELLRAGLPIIGLFLMGALGTMIGAIIGMSAVGGAAAIGPLYAPVGGMFVGTYIGGSINFNALALSYGVVREGVLYAGAIAVDNVITTAWMVVTIALPRLLVPLWPARRNADGTAAATTRSAVITGIEDDTETVHPQDLAALLALGLGAVWLSNLAAAWLAGAGVAIPSILLLTALSLALAQIPGIWKLPGARLLGMIAVYLFLAVIGAFCDVRALGQLGRLGFVLLGFAGILVLVHGIVLFGAARLFRIDLDMAAVASQANVGGSTSALALARSLGRGDLVLPAVLIGALGNAIGTFLGFWAAEVWL